MQFLKKIFKSVNHPIQDIQSKEAQLIEKLNENPRKFCDTTLEIDLRVTKAHFRFLDENLISSRQQ